MVEINLSDNAFGPIGLDALVNFFQSDACFTLKEIRMHNNGLGTEGAKKLAFAIEQCYVKSNKKFQLKVFICGRNRLEFEGSRALSHVIKQLGSLEEIQMPQNGIRPHCFEHLAEAFLNNPNLKIINLNDNTCRKTGALWLSKAFCKLDKLEYVNLGDCLLRSEGALHITRSLEKNEILKELIMSFNEIDTQTGLQIANLLKSKKTLGLIDLNGNRFGDDAKLEIKQILESFGDALQSLSEDEGDVEDDEEYSDEEEEESEEEEEEEAEYDEEDYDDYEQVNEDDYEDYEDEEGEENEENQLIHQYGDLNLSNNQQPATSNFFADLIRMTQPNKISSFLTGPTDALLLEINQSQIDSFNQVSPTIIRHVNCNGT
jgi:Ran GTPase-activating protein 1